MKKDNLLALKVLFVKPRAKIGLAGNQRTIEGRERGNRNGLGVCLWVTEVSLGPLVQFTLFAFVVVEVLCAEEGVQCVGQPPEELITLGVKEPSEQIFTIDVGLFFRPFAAAPADSGAQPEGERP